MPGAGAATAPSSPRSVSPACNDQAGTSSTSNARRMIRAASPSPEARWISPATMTPSQWGGAERSGFGASRADILASQSRRCPAGSERHSRCSGWNAEEETGIAPR